MRTLLSSASLLALLCNLPGCIDDSGPGTEDGENDSFVDGKSDTGAVQEGELRARAVIRFVNTAKRSELTAAGLTARVVDVLESFRAGDDERLGSSDDAVFKTLAELDAVRSSA
jgi:hypothetical protein